MRRLLLLAAVTALACGREAGPAIQTEIRDDLTRIEAGSVVLEVAPDVRYLLPRQLAHGGLDAGAATLDGHHFDLSDDRLRIGSVDFGPLPEGATVRISRAAGVVVDGEPRGSLPPPAE